MWLALDTATDQASVAVGGPGLTTFEQTIVGSRRHAAGLLPAIAHCLKATDTELDQLEAVVLADGPGSFTGLRVGAATAKALVSTHRVGLWTAPSLLACAMALGEEGRLVVAVSEALRGDLFAAAYRILPGEVTVVLEPSVHPSGNVLGLVRGADVVTGPAAHELGGVQLFPRAAALLSLLGRARGARRIPDPGGWTPSYGRPAEAQAQWERTHGRALPDSSRLVG